MGASSLGVEKEEFDLQTEDLAEHDLPIVGQHGAPLALSLKLLLEPAIGRQPHVALDYK
jgi:hypothetical protein